MEDTEVFTLSANSASAQAALDAVAVRLKTLRTEWTRTAKDASLTAEEFSKAEQKFIGQAKQLYMAREQTKRQIVEVSQGLEKQTVVVQKTTTAWGKLGGGIGQISYAADDFLTVWGQNGDIVLGLNAAANNISVVLAQFAPWAVIIPSLAVAGIKFATSTDSSSKSLKEQEKALKEAEKAAKQYENTINGISTAHLKMQIGAEAAEELARRRESRIALGKMRDQGRAIEAQMEKVKRDDTLTPFQKKARLHNLGLERNKLGARFQELQQQEIDIRNAFDKKQEEDKVGANIEQIRPGLENAARAMAAAGMDAESIAAKLAPHITGASPSSNVQAVLATADKIAEAGIKAGNADMMRAKGPATPEEMKLEEAKVKAKQLDIEKANAVVSAGGGKVQDAEGFRKREAELTALIGALELIVKQQKEKVDPMQKAADALERLAGMAGVPGMNGNQ